MYALGAIIRGQVPSLHRDTAISCKLFHVKHISKIYHHIPARCHTMRCIYMKEGNRTFRQVPVLFLPKRTYKSPLNQTFTPKHHIDNVPRDYELIYQANLGNRHTKTFFILGVVVLSYIGLFGYFFLLFSGNWKFDHKTTIPIVNITIPSLALQLTSIMLTFVILWIGLCNSFMRLPVQRIYESPCKNMYVGILKKSIFTTERVEFEVSDVVGIRPTRGQIMKTGNASIKGRNCLVYAVDFKLPEYFNKLLGYEPAIAEQHRSPVNGNSGMNNKL